MANSKAKPKLTSEQLVQKMRDEKGILFNLTTEKEAEIYLRDVNNYLRTASYRKNYATRQKGSRAGTYIGLDFAYLQELSALDMRLRSVISRMCMDIEHSLKVRLLKDIEQDSDTDGYAIVESFLDANTWIIAKIEGTVTSPFTGELIAKYFTIQKTYNKAKQRTENRIADYKNCPVWVLLEVITFGDFIVFYNYYHQSKGMKPPLSSALINIVKSLRNASAHNNCLLSNLSRTTSKPPVEVSKFVSQIHGVGKGRRQKRLSCRPMMEFATLLYVYKKIVTPRIADDRIEELKSLFSVRMMRHWRYFIKNDTITSTYFLAQKIITSLY
mgnify:CR=1 FL=1